jgi:hypothetical protein
MVAPGSESFPVYLRLLPKTSSVRPRIGSSVGKDPLRVVQQWTGEIYEIDGEMIYATMRDLTNTSMPDEQWMFSSINISEDQKRLICPGRTFTFDIWSNSTWVIKLIDNGKWTKEEIDQIEIEAKKMFEQFNPPTPTPQ